MRQLRLAHFLIYGEFKMTYDNQFCPHCHKSIGRVTGRPDNIGNPLKICPHCGRIIVDKFTREWVNKSPLERFFFFVKFPLTVAFISFIALAGILMLIAGESLGNVELIGIICGSFACAICLFIILYRKHKSDTKSIIAESLKRTQSARYVKLLQKAHLEIYPIKSVKIGTIQDCTEELDDEEDENQEEIE